MMNLKIRICLLLVSLLTFLLIFNNVSLNNIHFSNSVAVAFTTNSPVKKFQCPKHLVSVRDGGNLGNKIFEYMSLFSFTNLYSKNHNLQPYCPTAIKNVLEKYFERLSIQGPSGNISKDCYNTKGAYILQITKNLTMEEVANLNKPIVLAKYSARYADIIKNGIDNFKAELRFKSEYVKKTNDVLNKIKKRLKMQNENVTFVGMHYRGTDYNRYLKNVYKSRKPPPDHNYYWNTMSYFMKHYRNVIFILISIDKQWLKTNVPYLNKTAHLVVNPTNSKPAEDLALLSYCNHSIISYGTFASTAALYNEGTTFVYNLGVPIDQGGATVAMGIAQMLPSWHIRD